MKILTTIAVILMIGFSAQADLVKIDKKTPVITPVALIYSFDLIDWEKVEKNQDAGKAQFNNDFLVMQCDDSYYSDFEIKFDGFVGKDIEVDSQGCEFKGASVSFDGTVLQFNGVSSSAETDSCTVEVIQKRKDKLPLKMTFEIADAC